MTKKRGILIVLQAERFNRATLRGEGRVEDEVTLNPIFFGGFPKSAIHALYFPEAAREALEALAGSRPLSAIRELLRSEPFMGKGDKELLQIRRHLRAEDEVDGRSLSLYSRIRYYSKNKPLDLQRLQSDFSFATREEVYEESLTRLAAREIVAERLKRPKESLLGQDRLLRELTDEEFLSCKSSFFEMMSREILEMEAIIPLKPSKRRQRSLLERCSERLYGENGGIGIQGDIAPELSLEMQRRLRASLRVAALFCERGRGKTCKNQRALSAAMARESLAAKGRFFGLEEEDVEVAIAAIEKFDLFYRYTHPKGTFSPEELQKGLENAHRELGKRGLSLPYNPFCRLLFSLYLADASAFGAMRKARHLSCGLATLDFEKLDWLKAWRGMD